jgi:hypothetical protein
LINAQYISRLFGYNPASEFLSIAHDVSLFHHDSTCYNTLTTGNALGANELNWVSFHLLKCNFTCYHSSQIKELIETLGLDAIKPLVDAGAEFKYFDDFQINKLVETPKYEIHKTKAFAQKEVTGEFDTNMDHNISTFTNICFKCHTITNNKYRDVCITYYSENFDSKSINCEKVFSDSLLDYYHCM